MSLNLPLVAWGTIEDISAGSWSSLGTLILTAGVTDPFGGTSAVTINDTDAGVAACRYRNFSVAAGGTNWVGFLVQAGTSGTTDLRWYDITATAILAQWRLTWSGGVPTASLASGSGSVLAPVSLGAGWYIVPCSVNNVVAANSQRIYLYPASTTASFTGSTTFYWQSAVLLDFPDQPVAWSQNRDGSARLRSPSGNYDSWISGTDHHFQADIPWIPSTPRSTPVVVSGWQGTADIPCVNQGVSAMLAAGRNASPLRWVPDRSACTTYIDSELVDPWDPTVPQLEPDGTRKITLHLRNTATSYPLYT